MLSFTTRPGSKPGWRENIETSTWERFLLPRRNPARFSRFFHLRLRGDHHRLDRTVPTETPAPPPAGLSNNAPRSRSGALTAGSPIVRFVALGAPFGLTVILTPPSRFSSLSEGLASHRSISSRPVLNSPRI